MGSGMPGIRAMGMGGYPVMGSGMGMGGQQAMMGSRMGPGMRGLFGSRVMPMMNLSVDEVPHSYLSRATRPSQQQAAEDWGGQVGQRDHHRPHHEASNNSLVQRPPVDQHTGIIEYQN